MFLDAVPLRWLCRRKKEQKESLRGVLGSGGGGGLAVVVDVMEMKFHASP